MFQLNCTEEDIIGAADLLKKEYDNILMKLFIKMLDDEINNT